MESHDSLIVVLLFLTTTVSLTSSYGNGPTLSFQSKSANSPQIFSIPHDDLDEPIPIPEGRVSAVEIHESVTLLNQSENNLIVHSLGKGVVISLVKNIDLTESNIFISRDFGRKFEEASQLLTAFKTNTVISTNGTESATEKHQIIPIITRIYSPPQNNGKLVLIDDKNHLVFTTDNYATSFNASNISFLPEDITFDPRGGRRLLAYETENITAVTDNITTTLFTNKKLWLSRDFGASWTMVQEFVKSASWSPVNLHLYIHKKDPSQRSVIITSDSLFQDPQDTSTVLEDVDEFEIKDDYMFATKKFGNSSVQLWISYKHGRFVRALFLASMSIANFHIAHVSALDGRVFICLTHDRSLSNLYVANPPARGLEIPRFSLSLERIVFVKSNNTLTDGDTFADLHHIEGLPGVYVANVLTSIATNSSVKTSTVSMITFDNGGHWKPLNCSKERGVDCSLELGNHMMSAQNSKVPPVLSTNGDLILGMGTIKDLPPSLFISTDSAQSWKKSLDGNYLYNFGSQSGIIVAVKMYNNKIGDATDTLLYSTDKGGSWNSYKFFSNKIAVIGLMTETETNNSTNNLTENSTDFFIIGSTVGRKKISSSWVLIHVDLKNRKNVEVNINETLQDSKFILLANGRSVLRIDLNNLTTTNILSPQTHGKITAVDFDLKSNTLYWPNDNVNDNINSSDPHSTINRIRLSSNIGNESVIADTIVTVRGNSSLMGIAFDWLSQNLYFSDGHTPLIQVVRIGTADQMLRKTIVKTPDVVHPQGLAVHPAKGYLFWIDWSSTYDSCWIGRSQLDGSHFQKIIQNYPDQLNPLIGNTITLTIDYHEDRLYWVDTDLGQIAHSDLDGKDNQVLYGPVISRKISPFGIAVDRDAVYWADWHVNPNDSNIACTTEIYSLTKTKGSENRPENKLLLVLENEAELWDMKIFGTGMQDGSNICSLNTTCSHFCFNLPFPQNQNESQNQTVSYHTCECPDGLVKSNYNSTICQCLCQDGKAPNSEGFCELEVTGTGEGFTNGQEIEIGVVEHA